MNNTVLAPGDASRRGHHQVGQEGLLRRELRGRAWSRTPASSPSRSTSATSSRTASSPQPVKNATLIGTNVQILKEVEMIGNDLAFFLGHLRQGRPARAGHRGHADLQDPADDGGRSVMSDADQRSDGAGPEPGGATAARRAPPRSRCPSRRAASPASASSTANIETGSPSPVQGPRPARLRRRQGRQRVVVGLHARDARPAGGQRRRARPARRPGPVRRAARGRAGPVEAEELGIFDPAVPEVTPEEKIAIAKPSGGHRPQGRRASRSRSGASCISFDWNTTLANSKGFPGSYRSTAAYACGGASRPARATTCSRTTGSRAVRRRLGRPARAGGPSAKIAVAPGDPADRRRARSRPRTCRWSSSRR